MRPPSAPRCAPLLQTEAEAEAKAADTRCKHLQKQLAEQRKTLASKQKEGSKLQQELARERAAVEQCRTAAEALGHDPAAAAGLEQAAELAQAEVQRWRDRVDELSSQLAGELGASHGKGWALDSTGHPASPPACVPPALQIPCPLILPRCRLACASRASKARPTAFPALAVSHP